MALGGHGYDDKGSYESDALEGWKYEWEAYAQPDTPFQLTQPGEVGKLKNVQWVKFSPDGQTEIVRMPEDKMTTFERVILRHWTNADVDWEEGGDARESMVDSARPIRRESDKMSGTIASNRARGRKSQVNRGLTKEIDVDVKALGSLDEQDEQTMSDSSVGRDGNTQKRRLSIVTKGIQR